MPNLRQISAKKLIIKWRSPALLFFCALSLVALSTTGVLMAADPHEATYIKAEIYYIGWAIMPRTRLTLEGIRNSNDIKITVSNDFEVKHLVKDWLQLDKLELLNYPAHEDPRLVIDLFDKSGKRTTYYASWSSLISENGQRKRSINDAFRNKFHFATERR